MRACHITVACIERSINILTTGRDCKDWPVGPGRSFLSSGESKRSRPGHSAVCGFRKLDARIVLIQPQSENRSIRADFNLRVILGLLCNCKKFIGSPGHTIVARAPENNYGERASVTSFWTRITGCHLINVTGAGIRRYRWFPIILTAPDTFRIKSRSRSGFRHGFYLCLRCKGFATPDFLSFS